MKTCSSYIYINQIQESNYITQANEATRLVNLPLRGIICKGHHSFLQFPHSVIDSV